MANVLIGSVKVLPATVRPGQPVQVQVCDPSGKPCTADTAVRITIQGIDAPSRYSTAGKRNLTLRATQGATTESIIAEIQVSGEPLAFRRTLIAPTLTAMPILQLSQTLGSPYLATFSPGTPDSLLPGMTRLHPPTAPASSKAHQLGNVG